MTSQYFKVFKKLKELDDGKDANNKLKIDKIENKKVGRVCIY